MSNINIMHVNFNLGPFYLKRLNLTFRIPFTGGPLDYLDEMEGILDKSKSHKKSKKSKK